MTTQEYTQTKQIILDVLAVFQKHDVDTSTALTVIAAVTGTLMAINKLPEDKIDDLMVKMNVHVISLAKILQAPNTQN